MRRSWASMAAVLVGAAVASPATAATATLNWSTFLRAGPGAEFTAIDELQHGAPVDLGACAGRWCRVSDGAAAGWVDKDSLLLPATPTGGNAGAQSCFRSAQTSYKGLWSTRFCAAAPATGMSSGK